MMNDAGAADRRQSGADASKKRQCPWCGGELVLRPRYPRNAMVPGEVRAWEETDVPEALRTVRAWVCSTPHCKYRETA